MRYLYSIVQVIAGYNGKSNPEADKIIEEKLAKGENFDVKFLFGLYNLDINAKGEFENTALHMAVIEGHTETVKLLIDAGSDICAKDNTECTPLQLAIYQKREQDRIVELLSEAQNKQSNLENIKGNFALCGDKDIGGESFVEALAKSRENQRDQGQGI